MDILTIISVLIILSTAFSYINERFLRLPGTIGVMTISIVVSMAILIAGKTGTGLSGTIRTLAQNINFSKVLLDVMLGFLLFASALHFDYKKLKALRRPVFILSTIGVLVSASAFGAIFYGVTSLLNLEVPLIYCFIFGALISPTDPIAVAAIIKKSKIPVNLETIITGESMFNDAVGLILFVTLLGIAGNTDEKFSMAVTLQHFAREVLGGIILGAAGGWIGYRLIRSIQNFQTIFLISIALVLGLSVIANQVHASVPLAVVTAGLIIGNLNFGKDHIANKYLRQVWQLLDEVLNTVLFVMIGLQLMVLPFVQNYWVIGCLSILIILIARFISVSLPVIFIIHKVNFGSLSIVTWAGLRGGISIAMALSLPESDYREIILSTCYFIVIFSIIVQGLTLNRVVNLALKNKPAAV